MQRTTSYACIPRLLFIGAMLSVAVVDLSCSNRRSEVTITTAAGRVSTIPHEAKPVSLQPNLPSRNPELEAAGDKIAEAIVYLNTHRKERHDVARALDQAGMLIARAEQKSDDEHRRRLHDINDGITSISKTVQHPSSDLARQLLQLNEQIDIIQNEEGGFKDSAPVEH